MNRTVRTVFVYRGEHLKSISLDKVDLGINKKNRKNDALLTHLFIEAWSVTTVKEFFFKNKFELLDQNNTHFLISIVIGKSVKQKIVTFAVCTHTHLITFMRNWDIFLIIFQYNTFDRIWHWTGMQNWIRVRGLLILINKM